MKGWSLASQFRDFGRGVISLSSVAFLLADRRGDALSEHAVDRPSSLAGGQGWHVARRALLRAAARVLAAAGGLVLIIQRFDRRLDISSEQLSSLSPKTKKLIEDLDPKHPVQIDAYISPSVPESYVADAAELALRAARVRGHGPQQDHRQHARYRAFERERRAGRAAVRHSRPQGYLPNSRAPSPRMKSTSAWPARRA